MARVRRAGPADYSGVVALCHAVPVASPAKDKYRQAIDRGDCFVAHIAGELAGVALKSDWFFDRPFISLVIVHPSHRRKGVGTDLIRFVGSMAPGQLFTSTNRSNARMRSLLAKLGFQECGYIEQIDEDDPEIVYVAARALAPPSNEEQSVGDHAVG